MRIDKRIVKTVCYIGYRRADRTVKIGGTAFFIECPGLEGFVLVGTAQHVIRGIREEAPGNPVTLWVNHKEDGMKTVDTDPDRWIFHPSTPESVDVAVYKDPFPLREWDHYFILKEAFVSDEFLRRFHVGVGDESYFPGLFVWHTGRTRLSPIVRQGTIAGMPEEPIESVMFGPMEAFLAEVRSIGGLSGSPVFIHKSFWRYPGELSDDDEASDAYFKYSANTEHPNPESFIGLVHGHFDEKGKIIDTLTAYAVNTGISVVVPAKHIREVVYQEKIMKKISDLEDQMKKQGGPTPDTPTADFVVSSGDDDLTKADFDDALVRKPRESRNV